MQTCEGVLKILSYNVLLDWRKEGPYIWSNRRDLVAGILRHSDADVIGLQEPLRHQVDELVERLPGYAWLGAAREDGKDKGEFAPILYKKNRLELLDQGNFWLSETPDVAGSLGWDAACVRVATWACFRDKQTGRMLYHFNTHFDHVGQQAQIESARLLLERMRSLAGKVPCILTGDFNCTGDAEPYKILVGASKGEPGEIFLKDASCISPDKPYCTEITFHGFGAEEEQRIDYIFASPAVTVLEYTVMKDIPNALSASDHYPVAADAILG